MLIGVLSDTHIPARASTLPGRVIEAFRGVDLILHAGDITTLAVLQRLSTLAPIEAVHGNVDPPEVSSVLPRTRIVALDNGKRIGLVHGNSGPGVSTLERARRTFEGQRVDVIVFGHSHTPYCEWHDGVLLFNPGSPTDKRRMKRASYGLLRVDETITGEIVYL